jgi:hypothetical protein
MKTLNLGLFEICLLPKEEDDGLQNIVNDPWWRYGVMVLADILKGIVGLLLLPFYKWVRVSSVGLEMWYTFRYPMFYKHNGSDKETQWNA